MNVLEATPASIGGEPGSDSSLESPNASNASSLLGTTSDPTQPTNATDLTNDLMDMVLDQEVLEKIPSYKRKPRPTALVIPATINLGISWKSDCTHLHQWDEFVSKVRMAGKQANYDPFQTGDLMLQHMEDPNLVKFDDEGHRLRTIDEFEAQMRSRLAEMRG